MPLDTDACLAAIERHSGGFAEAAGRKLSAPVPSCPGWDVAELVRHLTRVHWFWTTIAEERLAEPPDEERGPQPAEPDGLLRAFRAGADQLVSVLRDADQSAPVWTWAPQQRDIGFITRHQVQEAAVHHWDAANATGAAWSMEPAAAADAVDEFLAFSVANEAYPADPPRGLDGSFAIRCTDVDAGWTVRDGSAPGTLTVTAGAARDMPLLQAPAADLLLWLYKRGEVIAGRVPADLLERFQSLMYTD